MPSPVQAFVDSWRRQLPDYEVMEWNERNFDVNAWRYTSEAYSSGKFAYVSDVARLHALHTCGGIYLDTDVEVKRSLNELLAGPVVLGFEEGDYIATSTIIAPAGSRLIGDFLESYRLRSFLRPDGTPDQTTNVQMLTSILESAGLIRNGAPQEVTWQGERVQVLDRVKISPIDYPNGISYADESTYTIHYFGQSWASPTVKMRTAVRKALIALIGGAQIKRLRALFAADSGPQDRNSKGIK